MMAELVDLAPCLYRSRMEAVELTMEGLARQPDPCPKPDGLRREIKIRVAIPMVDDCF